MLFCLLFLTDAHLIAFNNTQITKGFQVNRFIDSTGLSFVSNLLLSNCTKNKECELDIIYYKNEDRANIFSNITKKNFQNLCTKKNQLSLPKNKNYTYVKYIVSNEMKFVTIPFASEAIWSVLVTTCIDNETTFSIDGYVDYKPNFSTYIDQRIEKISTFCLSNSILNLIFLVCYAIAQKKFNTQLTTIQISFYLVIFFSIISDFFIYLQFNFYDKNHFYLFYLFFFSALLRSVSRTLIFKVAYDYLDFPNIISILVTIPLLLIFSVAFYFEFVGVSEITSRFTGDWFFGYSKLSFLLFLSIVLATVYIIYASYNPSSKSTIANTQKRQKYTLFLTVLLILFIVTSLFSIVLRFNKSLEFTRNIELYSFALEPVYFFLLVLANAWFIFVFSSQGWEQMGNETGTLDQNQDNGSLVGNGYGLPSYMVNQETKFVVDGNNEDDAAEN